MRSLSSFRRPEVVLVAIVTAALVVVGVIALTRGDQFDRSAAIERVVATSSGRITADQAGCYVDRVRHQVGAAALSPRAHPSDAVTSRMTAIRVDCVGVANLGVAPIDAPAAADTSVPSTESGNLPRRPGDDATLDALYQQCQAGFGQACDDLFAKAPVGSDYESFAVTCGNRTRELSCVTLYVAPGVTNPPTTTTSSPPG
jgi:hypothetical protein